MEEVYNSTKKTFSIFPFETPEHRSIIWYEARDGLLQDLECSYPINEGDDFRAEPDDTKAKERMLQKFADFHPTIVKVLHQASRVTDWELWQGTGVWTMRSGQTLLIGDAAHSMLPFTGQGGGQGIEDAGALGVLFRDIKNREEIQERLKLFEELRRERTAIFQSMAGVKLGTEDHFARENPGHLIHKTSVRSAEEHIRFFSEYNVLLESQKVLAKHMKP